VRGAFAPVVGRVSMDLTLVDVTDCSGVSLHDQVTLLGRDGELSITAEDLAELTGTISYEITVALARACRGSIPIRRRVNSQSFLS